MTRNGYQHMVLEYYVGRLRALRAVRRQRLADIRTRGQAIEYQHRVRRAIAKAFRPRPRRTPLDAQITGTVQQQGYRIEKLLYASRPGCLVTGHLYIPDKLTGPAPGVIGTCGHSDVGKTDELYQAFCQRLARAGFVVLIYDPFNQGERDQYWKLSDKSAVANCCHAHNMMGKQLELVGEWFGAWRAWDGIRALDYLLSRPEVDPTRVGLTGNSGGGTMTTWLWAIENRFTMAAPSCFVTTFLSNLENELPADCEQYPPSVIGAGLELADFFIARAPEPVLLLGQNYDFFDRRGLREAHQEVRRFYDLLGALQEDAQLFIGPEGHGFSRHNQEAMVDFFARQAGLSQPRKMRRPVVLTADQLNVTPRGNTVEAGAVPIYDLTAAAACRLEQKRAKIDEARLVQRLTARLQLPRKRSASLRCVHRPNASLPENGILMHKCLAPYSLDVEGEVHLYLPHVSAKMTCRAMPWPLPWSPAPALCPRCARFGRIARKRFFHPYGMDYMFHGQVSCWGRGAMLNALDRSLRPVPAACVYRSRSRCFARLVCGFAAR